MNNYNTVFGHLATRFTAHPENLATEALLYVLEKSESVGDLFSKYFPEKNSSFPQIARYSSQVFSEANTIPDLVGTDASGANVFIVENKFWAELTPNQPLGYLPLLPEESPGALIFVCPEKRLSILNLELKRLINDSGKYPNYSEVVSTENLILNAISDSKFLMLISWRKLLTDLESCLDPIKERNLISDLHQLNGLCENMDRDGFIPLRSHEIGNLDIPKRILQYPELILGAVSKLRELGYISTSGLQYTSTNHWTGQYIFIPDSGRVIGSLIALDLVAWKQNGKSPIWLEFTDGQTGPDKQKQIRSIFNKTDLYMADLQEPNGKSRYGFGTPLYLLPNVESNRVVDSIVTQVQEIADLLLPEFS
jgi:hypothetical protein